jgi:hypothetical protein
MTDKSKPALLRGRIKATALDKACCDMARCVVNAYVGAEVELQGPPVSLRMRCPRCGWEGDALHYRVVVGPGFDWAMVDSLDFDEGAGAEGGGGAGDEGGRGAGAEGGGGAGAEGGGGAGDEGGKA